MKRPSLPILAWVIIGLVVVAALPLVTTILQIDRSRDALVVETQQTQLLVARTVAEELARGYRVLDQLLRVTGDDPDLYLEPDSDAARASLQRLLEMAPEFRAVGLFVRREGEAVAVMQLRRGGETLLPADFVQPGLSVPPGLIAAGEERVTVLQRETTRPGLFINALADPPRFDAVLDMPGLTEADLAVIDGTGTVLTGSSQVLAAIPEVDRETIISGTVAVGSGSEYGTEVPIVWAFDDVPGTDWRVVSMQPAASAQTATAEMRTGAQLALAITLAVVVLLSLGAWFAVIRPIRRLVVAQRELLGGRGAVAGGEIEQLEASFEKLADAMRERDTLTEVFLDRYQVLSPLGEGAMGMVYVGWDPKLDRRVALKTIRLDDSIPGDQRQRLANRLLQEGLTAAKLTHPNIVTVFDVLGDDQHAFIAMELVEGRNLDEVLESDGQLPPAQVVRMAEDLLRALRAAHEAGVVHRDIKPGNIMVTDDGTFMLADFGIASFRSQVASGDEGMVMGTPGYLAPECYAEKTQDPRTDLFALGVTLVECLTCRKVFHGKSVEQVIVRTSSWEVEVPPDLAQRLPEGMDAFLKKLVAKRPGDRYQSAAEALAALRAIIDPEGASEEARARANERDKEQRSREDVPTQAMGDPDLGATREFDS